jgi:hypothetical protein
MKKKFTKLQLEGQNGRGPAKSLLPKGGASQIDHRDNQDGLGVRITKAGKVSFFVWYRFNGEPRRDTLQPAYPGLTLTAARDEAIETLRDIQAGRDPRDHEREPRRHIYLRKYPPAPVNEGDEVPKNFGAAVDDWYKRELVGSRELRTAKEYRRAVLKACSDWTERKVADITAQEIQRRLDSIRDVGLDKGPSKASANRLWVYLGGFFKWASESGQQLVSVSPMSNMAKPWKKEDELRRTRADGSAPVYNDDELAAIWAATDQLERVSGAYIKICMLLCKRKTALAEMRWSEIDDNGYWTPAPGPKNKRRNPIQLPSLVQRILDGLPKVEGNPYVFVGRRTGTHLDPGTPLQEKIRKASGVADFSYHPLKHTMKTRLTETLEVLPHIADLVSDHELFSGAGARYVHGNSYRDDVAAALEVYAEHVTGILKTKKVLGWSGNVEPLRG